MKMEDEKDQNLEKKEEETGDKKADEAEAPTMEISDCIGHTRGVEIERKINEEYKIWKNETPFLYDLVISRALEWPSLTVEWLPEQVVSSDGDYSVQKIIFGTHTTDDEPNYIFIAQVKLPLFDADYDSDNNESDIVGRKIEVVQQICHKGEVQRARCMPQNSQVIATKTNYSDVLVFDYGCHRIKPFSSDEECSADLVLRGHESDGFGLSWSQFKEGWLLSGSYDGRICMWDISKRDYDHILDAMQTYKVHHGPVEDVAWSMKHDYLFASCGYDKYLHIFDFRSPCFTRPIQSLKAHKSEINCLSFNPFNEWVVATGSTDETMKLFDLRKFTSALHTFTYHKSEVVQVGWSPHNETILASCSKGRRLMVWDCSRIGQEQSSRDAEDGPPELIFIHAGHTNRIADFSWNPSEEWMIASVSDDNVLQVWQMADHIYNDEY